MGDTNWKFHKKKHPITGVKLDFLTSKAFISITFTIELIHVYIMQTPILNNEVAQPNQTFAPNVLQKISGSGITINGL